MNHHVLRSNSNKGGQRCDVVDDTIITDNITRDLQDRFLDLVVECIARDVLSEGHT